MSCRSQSPGQVQEDIVETLLCEILSLAVIQCALFLSLAFALSLSVSLFLSLSLIRVVPV